MPTTKNLLLTLLLSVLCIRCAAEDASIRFAALLNSAMPTASFEGDRLQAGMLRDLGEAIAKALHRKVFFVTLPRNRLEDALKQGQVDGVCNMRDTWLGVSLNWSQALVPDENLIVTRPGTPSPKSLSELEGKTVGTVLGFKYPDLDRELAQHYRRDDAYNTPLNIHKLVIGRVAYIVVDRMSFDYQAKLNPSLRTYSFLPISAFDLKCGFSPSSQIPFHDIDEAIKQIVQDGTVRRIRAAYR